MIDYDYHEIHFLYYWIRDLDSDFIYDGYCIEVLDDYDRYIDDWCHFDATILNMCAGYFDY